MDMTSFGVKLIVSPVGLNSRHISVTNVTNILLTKHRDTTRWCYTAVQLTGMSLTVRLFSKMWVVERP